MKVFDHIGIPTDEPQPGESWVPFSQVWVTNPRTHPQRIEYFRPKEPPEVPPADGASGSSGTGRTPPFAWTT